MAKKNRFKFPFAKELEKQQKCKHPDVKEPAASAAVPVKCTCPACGATGFWNWNEARFVADGSLDVNVVRENESGRGPGERDRVKRMMPSVDIHTLDGGSDEE